MERYCQDRVNVNDFGYENFLKQLSEYNDVIQAGISEKQQKYKQSEMKINAQKKRFIVFTTISVFILLIILTYLLGTFVFVKEIPYTREEITNGQDVVCYLTDTGDCYHKRNCSFLYSVNETTMYQAEKEGYYPCSYCWSYPKPHYEKISDVQYERYYGIIFFILFVILLVTYVFINVKYNKKCRKRIDIEKNKLNVFKKAFLIIIESGFGKEDSFSKKAMYYSKVPSEIEYKNGLPRAEDDRFTVYKSQYGKSYHTNSYCRHVRMNYELHIYVAMRFLSPCHFCTKAIEIPEWHKKYKKLYNLYKNMISICE